MSIGTRDTKRGDKAARRPFENDRLTYRLDVLAHEAIALNDAIFVREVGCRIRDLRVLRLIDDNPGTSFAEIAKATGFERSLTSRIIRALIEAGLIARENSAADARVFELRTTKRGREVRRVARQLSDRLEVTLTEPLSRREMAQLDALLEKLQVWVNSKTYRSALEEI